MTAIEGRFLSASNATLLGATASGERVVYKPIAGEAPLWDFESETLAIREVLTFVVATALGLDVVPETVLGDGVFGPGSVQRFVETDDDFDPLPLVRRHDARLWPVAVLDVVCNNADRKLGHILQRRTGELAAIDHGLTFHPQDKLRTVLWTFAGQPVPTWLRESLERLDEELKGGLGARIEMELGRRELIATRRRVEALLSDPRHPLPPTDRPAVPWPPY